MSDSTTATLFSFILRGIFLKKLISAQIDIQINTNYTSQLTCLLAKFPSIFASQARPAKTSENNETEFDPPLLSCACMKCPPASQRAPGWDFQAAQGTGRTLGSLASPHLHSLPLSAQPFKHNSSNSLWVAPLSVHLWTKIKKNDQGQWCSALQVSAPVQESIPH